MVSPLKMYSKYGLGNSICSAKWGKLVGKWPMADCYFKLCNCIILMLASSTVLGVLCLVHNIICIAPSVITHIIFSRHSGHNTLQDVSNACSYVAI